jgi:CRP/FNR family transcriptional regulator, cyclic AMP receptor protein
MATLHNISVGELQMLARLSPFVDAPEGDLLRIASLMTRRSFERGEVIYHQEDVPNGFFILLRGRVKIRLVTPDRRRQVTLSWVHPGGQFGVTNIFSGGHHNSDAVSIEASEVLFLRGDDLRAYLKEHPGATERYLEYAISRWSMAIRRFYDQAFLDVPGRLAKALLQFVEQADEGANGVLPSSLTQRELASLIGTTRESTNKWMLYFMKRGWIEFKRGRIKVLQPEELQRQVNA